MPPTFQRTYPPSLPVADQAYWFPFHDGELIVERHEKGVALIKSDEAGMIALQPQSVIYLGTLDEMPCLACEVSAEVTLPPNYCELGLRALFGQIDETAYSIVGYAFQLLNWQRHSRYCPVCGNLTESLPGGWGKQCPNCAHISYPPVVPAILVLVHDGRRVLLSHKPGWGKRYSIIAGFVEPGESLEECVRREIYEEVGVTVTDITYLGSQPWPYPHQLMIGYTARYTNGEIRLDPLELDDAKWFDVDMLPELPPPLSLARKIIDTWVDSQRRQSEQP